MRTFLNVRTLALALAGAGLCACAPATEKAPAANAEPHVAASSQLAAGKYLVMVGGCNDCHTPGFPQSGGKVPEAEQLVGNPVGYHGPWGTSYAANLRLLAQNTTEEGWIEILRTKPSLPPMPTHNIAKMSDADLRALHAYIKSLGAAGSSEPENLPPGQKPAGPYEDMSVVTPPKA